MFSLVGKLEGFRILLQGSRVVSLGSISAKVLCLPPEEAEHAPMFVSVAKRPAGLHFVFWLKYFLPKHA